MDFIQFKEELREILSDYVEKQLNGTLRLETVQKNRGEKSGFVYLPDNGNVGITLYAEDAYEAYQDGKDIEQIAIDMVGTMMAYSMEQETKIDVKETFKPENIVPALVPSEDNEELLKTVPHVPFENLEIIFKFSLPDFKGGGTANVTNTFMEQYGWDEKKLLETAMNNPAYRDEIRLVPLMGIPFGEPWVSGKDDFGFMGELSQKTVVISNSSIVYGAAAIMDKDVMKKVADAFGDDIYIIPSSVHECILMPKSEMPLEELQQMVYEINRATVSPEERLSDDIYFFDSITKELTMASGQKERTEHQEAKEFASQRR